MPVIKQVVLTARWVQLEKARWALEVYAVEVKRRIAVNTAGGLVVTDLVFN